MTGIVAHTYPEWWLKLAGQVAHWSTDYSCNKMLTEIRQTILEAETKDDVIDITLAMIDLQVPILYEPRYTDFGYESCFMCNEYLQIRILHREQQISAYSLKGDSLQN